MTGPSPDCVAGDCWVRVRGLDELLTTRTAVAWHMHATWPLDICCEMGLTATMLVLYVHRASTCGLVGPPVLRLAAVALGDEAAFFVLCDGGLLVSAIVLCWQMSDERPGVLFLTIISPIVCMIHVK